MYYECRVPVPPTQPVVPQALHLSFQVVNTAETTGAPSLEGLGLG